MEKRTNTAKWDAKRKRWRISAQRDGVRRNFYSSTPGRAGQREANAKADKWLDDGIEGGRQKVSVLYARFIEAKKARTSRGHWEPVVSRWKNHISPMIGEKRIEKVTENDLQRVIDKAYSEKHLAAKTLAGIRTDLAAFIKFCRREKVTSLIPEELTIPASAKRPQKRIVQPHDLIKLMNIETTLYRGKPSFEPYIHAYRLEVLTGLRPGEINGLEWPDIVGREIHLQRAKNSYKEITQGKNENAVRRIVLSDLAYKELEAQRQLTGDGVSVFDITSLAAYRTHWDRYLKSNGMEKTTPYELRHTFVSIAKKLPEGMVKSLVGHSQSMDTFGIYGHDVDGEANDTAQRVNGLFVDILTRKA